MNNETATPGIRIKVYVREDMIGMGKIDLLRLVAAEGSARAAAAKMGVNRERASFLLDTLQRCFEAPLLAPEGADAWEATRLTPLGEELIRRHDAHLEAVAAASGDYLDWLEGVQRQA